MDERILQFLFTAMPVIIAAFFTVSLTLICPWKWVTALVQIPVWVALIWWTYALRNYYNMLLD